MNKTAISFKSIQYDTFPVQELGMLEVAAGKGCELLSKGHFFKKRAETKMKGHFSTYNLI
jgi:hypothetical protein